jgi:hypothetical protein
MENLRGVLAQEDTVLFVGSGISMWSGLPSWPGLIEELAKFVEASGETADLVRSEAQRGELLQAASYGFHKLTKPQIGEFVRKACQYGAAKPHAIHQKLVSLGPRCFVTTNYDDLLEQSLRIWQQDRFFPPPVTNRHLTETAGIIHARAKDFIFKPHGDAADCESIILTREQYRQLLPGGERNAALESLKMLLATRPVVYIGFGLRDPDFLYVRDVLSNTYKGGVRDHYAIMADIGPAEVEYWRSEYGIHLLNYATSERADKSRDHCQLLKLLGDLLVAPPPIAHPALAPDISGHSPPEEVLALARHAAGLTRAVRKDPELPLRVHLEEHGRRRGRSHLGRDEFDHSPVERFLDEGPARALLIGLPGSGKSYSLQRAAARLGERLHDSCLSPMFEEGNVVVPLLADLKLYHGDLSELVNSTLPSCLSLDRLGRRFKLKIFLDSFNEMPREYWETGSYESDFARFVEKNAGTSLIVGSRTSDGLDKLEFPVYRIDQIDERFVTTELRRLNISVAGRFSNEVEWLLQQPFYFQMVASRTIKLPDDVHPRDFYKIFFNGLTGSFRERFGPAFDLEHALSLCAYEAINQGQEARPLAEFLEVLRTELQGAGLAEIRAEDVTNWLVSKSVAIPYRGSRLAFFHQSATEYLAACELAHRYLETPQILKEKLRLTRWDQALFLTLSLLPHASAEAFFQTVVESDFALALNAAKYVEAGRDEIVAKLLAEIPARIEELGPFESRIESAVEFALPISYVHEPQLRALMKCRGIIGAAAVKRLVEFKGASVKDELLQALVEERDDYNYCCLGIGEALQDFASPEDAQRIATLADQVQSKVPADADDDAVHGFTSGAAELLGKIDLEIIRAAFLPKNDSDSLPWVRAEILCDILRDRHSTAALDLAAELLVRGVDEAATIIFFISEFAGCEDRPTWSNFSSDHVDRLIGMFGGEQNDTWALRALHCICAASPDITKVVREHASKSSGIARAALLWCTNSKDNTPIFEALAQLAEMSAEDRRKQPVHLIQQIEPNWEGREKLYVRLLRLRDTRLALALLGTMCPLNVRIGELEIGELDWWLAWLNDEQNTDSGYWFHALMASLFATRLSAEARQPFIAEFNRPESPYRRLLAQAILPDFQDLSTDTFTETTISFLLADLSRARSHPSLKGHLLGTTATEPFVIERLLPLLSDATETLFYNLRDVLRRAGSRHGRRYIAT